MTSFSPEGLALMMKPFLNNDSRQVSSTDGSGQFMEETSHALLPTFDYDVTTSAKNLTLINITTEPYVRPFSDANIVVSATIILLFLVLGLFGNIVTIVVITTNKKLKNIFMHFILSLCVSDLLSALTSWLFLYRRTWGFDVWAPVPAIFCKFYWATDLMTNYVTALHILSFAILRYISIQFPITFAKLKLKHGRIWMVTIWIVCFLVGFVPYFILFSAKFRDRTSQSPDSRWPACTVDMDWYQEYITYAQVGYSTFLYAPTIGVVLMSLLIGVTVRSRTTSIASSRNTEKQKRKERQAVLQLILIVFSFLIGYIPFTAYEFWSVEPRPNTMYFRRFDYWFGMSEYFFLRFSECLNPVFYNLGSAKMRGCTFRFFKKHFSCLCGKSTATSMLSNTSSSSQTREYGV